MKFEEQYFSCYILLPDQIHCVVYLSFVRQWAMGSVFVNQVEISKHFKINLAVLVKLVFYMTNKSRKKKNIFRTKRTFKMTYKAFFIIFEVLYKEGESSTLKETKPHLAHFSFTYKKKILSRTSCSQMFFELDILKNFAIATGNSIKLQALRPVTF